MLCPLTTFKKVNTSIGEFLKCTILEEDIELLEEVNDIDEVGEIEEIVMEDADGSNMKDLVFEGENQSSWLKSMRTKTNSYYV